MIAQRATLLIAVAIVAAGADAPGAEEKSTTLTPQALQEIAQVEAEIDRIEAQAFDRGRSTRTAGDFRTCSHDQRKQDDDTICANASPEDRDHRPAYAQSDR